MSHERAETVSSKVNWHNTGKNDHEARADGRAHNEDHISLAIIWNLLNIIQIYYRYLYKVV
jgi:hypothetical protein